MIVNTCSGVMGFAKVLETESSRFYEALSERLPENQELFAAFVRENRGYLTQIERAYYGVITDALEGCFAFHLDSEGYGLKTEIAPEMEDTDLIRQAIDIEEKIVKFYTEAAEQSKALMADVPMAFRLVAKKRRNRLSVLRSLLQDP